MGEAKNRGTFEERKTQASKSILRGVVTTPGQLSIKDDSYKIVKHIRDEDLLYYALYWDKIIMPSGMVRLESDLIDELIRAHILSRPNTYSIAPHPSYMTEKGFSAAKHELYAYGEIAKKKVNEKLENWMISHIDGDPIYDPLHCEKENSLRLRVTEILPFPVLSGNFSIDDLLNFKHRRSSELLALHESMDNLIKNLHNEPIQAIQETELKRFSNAIDELDRTLLERFKVIQKSDWEVSFSPNVGDIINEAPKLIGGITLDNLTNNNIPIFSTLAGLYSMLSVTKNFGFTFNQYARDDFKLAYISGAKSEKIVK